MKKAVVGLFALAGIALAGTSASAGPSAKFAANLDADLSIIELASYGPATILNTTIKTGNKKDLLIGVSLQTSLFTLTQVKGKAGATDTSSAKAGITIQVLVDGVAAAPGPVIFDERLQDLSATLGGVLESCADTGTFTDTDTSNDTTPDGVITAAFECTFTDEMIQLILDTTAAHHFNFVAPNVAAGDHAVEVKATIGSDTSFGSGTAAANASIKVGSLTVEGLRATNSPDGIVID